MAGAGWLVGYRPFFPLIHGGLCRNSFFCVFLLPLSRDPSRDPPSPIISTRYHPLLFSIFIISIMFTD